MKLPTRIQIAVVMLLLSCPVAWAQTAKEALTALQNLQNRCETGIAYRDYSAALAEAKFPLRQFAESEDAATNTKFIAGLQKAVEHYEFAGTLWSARFSAPRDDRMLSGGFIYHKGPLGKQIKERYPEAQMMNRFFPLDLTLPHIWSHASTALDEAAGLIASVASSESDALRAENERLRAELELEELRRENEKLKQQLDSR